MFMVKREPRNSAEVAAAMVDSIQLVPAIAVFLDRIIRVLARYKQQGPGLAL